MNLLKDIGSELIGMFFADVGMTVAVLALVAAAAAVLGLLHVPALAAGLLLLCGSLAIVVTAVFLEAARRRA